MSLLNAALEIESLEIEVRELRGQLEYQKNKLEQQKDKQDSIMNGLYEVLKNYYGT